MASATSIFRLVARSRGRSFFLPREHGAWGMLLVPLVTGAAAGNPHGERIIWILLFAAVALGLFCLRTPVEAALGFSPLRPQNDGERRLVHSFIYFYASVAVLALAASHVLGARLWTPAVGRGRGDGFSSSGGAETTRPGNPHERPTDGRHRAELHGGGSLLPGDGSFRPPGRNHLAGQLAFRRQPNSFRSTSNSFRAGHDAREKFRQEEAFCFTKAFHLLFLGLIWRAGWLPGLILMAFGPLFFRGFAWFFESPRPLQVHRLGISELLYAIVFGMFFIAGFHHPMG